VFNWKETFASFRTSIDDAEKMVSEATENIAGGVTITNNNGHIVIVGPIKSLRINDEVIK